MITKAIIEEVITPYQMKVRIPFFNKTEDAPNATPTSELYTATICALPNSLMNYQVGDIVFVGFENHLAHKPIILGQLSRLTKTAQNSEITANSVNANVDAFLPYNTYIGDIIPDELTYLKGVNKNLQFQLDILSDRIAKLEEAIEGK